MYKLTINQGQGFIEFIKLFNNLDEACNYALKFDNVKIYKNNIKLYENN